MTAPASWPDSNAFWRDQRVVVTGRRETLCVGSCGVEKLQARGAAEVFVPRSEEHNPSTLPFDRLMGKPDKHRTKATVQRLE